MTIDKIIYDVREALKEYSNDSELDDRYIIHLYDIKRAKYIRQELNNFRHAIDISVKQTLCVELEEISKDECGDDIPCDRVLRTVRPLPDFLQLHHKPAIMRVGNTDRFSRPFSIVPMDGITYAGDSPFPNSVYASLHTDGHLYLNSEANGFRFLNCITVTGVFEHPLDLQSFKNCCGCTDTDSCYDMSTTDYPIQPHLIDLIKNEIVNELVKLKQIPEDKLNDSDSQ